MTTENSRSAAFADAAHRSAGSFELVLGPVIMALIGLLADGVFGTRPLLTVLFTIWGALGAGVSIYFRYRHQFADATVSAGQLRSSSDPAESDR